jgi:putative transposase
MRAKPLLVGAPAARLRELLREKAEQLGVGLRKLDILPACVYLQVEAPPTIAPHSIVCGLKAHTSGALRREYKEFTTIPTLWTREYLVAAGEHIAAEQVLAAFAASLPPRRPRGRPRCP